ncbi:MAG: hypothetical protein H7281_05970, partial [Bacteriovorax sp.]|nr:hypothetical protein [Bacteriovorax sp.]
SFAKFFVQTGDYKFPKIYLVAEGKLIKSFPKKSIWYMSKIYDPRFIKAMGHLLVLTSNQVKAGRPMRVKQRHVVLSPNEYGSVDQYLEENKNNVPDRLLQSSNAFEESDELYETKKVPEADLLVQTYEHMRKNSGVKFSDQYNDDTEEKYFVGNREVKIADIANAEDKKLLDSIAAGYIEKINSQKYELAHGLYKDQNKVSGTRDINDKITIDSVYDTIKEDRKIHEQINPKAISKIKRDGPQWSEDMDDATLRRYFIRTGLEHEERRRELVLNELDGNEVMIHYSGSMADHSTSLDQNYRNLGYTLGLGYDLHLSRTSKDLKNWSLQFVLEKGVADYDVGGLNARGQEGYYGAYLNYYFINNPLTLNSFIFLGGIGLKAGSIEMQARDLSKKYTYQVLALPALQLLTKYRFRSGDLTEDSVNVGASLNAGINLDMKRLSVVDSLDDKINGKISINDIKYLLGMSFYF